jgi:hypothetical protein
MRARHGLLRDIATVDDELGAGDERGFVGGEEQYPIGDLDRLADPWAIAHGLCPVGQRCQSPEPDVSGGRPRIGLAAYRPFLTRSSGRQVHPPIVRHGTPNVEITL